MTISFTSPRGRTRQAARPSIFFSVAAAVLLALTACGGPAAPAPSGNQEDKSAVADSTAVKTAEKAAEKTVEPAAAPAKEYTEAELTAILSGLKDGQGNPLTMIPADVLAKGTEDTKKTLADVKITPEECRVFASSNAELPSGSVFAAGTWVGDAATGAATAVTLLSAKPELLSATLDRAASKRGVCDNFSMEVAGQAVDTTLKSLTVDTAADSESATLINQNVAGGMTINTVTVEALQGGLLISVVQLGPDTQETAAAELAKVVDQILAAS